MLIIETKDLYSVDNCPLNGFVKVKRSDVTARNGVVELECKHFVIETVIENYAYMRRVTITADPSSVVGDATRQTCDFPGCTEFVVYYDAHGDWCPAHEDSMDRNAITETDRLSAEVRYRES